MSQIENVVKNTVVLNSFVRRQTQDSPYSYFDGRIEDVAVMAQDGLKAAENVRMGNRSGVILVRVDPTGFYSGVVEVNENTRLVARFVSRREPEAKFVQVTADGARKLPAQIVDLVLYRRDLLDEKDRSPAVHPGLFAEYEVVSINASVVGGEPLNPLTMARNMLKLQGGTECNYTAEEFAKSIVFWSDKVMAG